MDGCGAERRARLEFGNVEQMKEACREARRVELLDSFFGDVRFGLRLLRRSRSFAGLAVFTLALGIGIGAATAVFSLVNAVLLRELPYPHPDRLMFLYEPIPGIPNAPLEAWGPVNGDFFTWRKESRSFSEMAMFTTDGLNASSGDPAFRAGGSRVTTDFFRVLGVLPLSAGSRMVPTLSRAMSALS